MTNDHASIIDSVIDARHSVRAYRPDPVPADLVERILDVAARAPSGCNGQPWRVYVLTEEARQRVVDAVCHAYDSEHGLHQSEWQHTPPEFFEPYLSRRRKMGFALYGLAGIEKGDKERMRMQQRRNYEFFDAPVGLLFTVHRDLPPGSLLGYGAFLQNIMVSARGHGLDTCFQTGWADYHRVISPIIGYGKEELLLGGMALGFADPNAPVNTLRTEREPLAGFASFLRE